AICRTSWQCSRIPMVRSNHRVFSSWVCPHDWTHYLYTVVGLGSFPEKGQLHGLAEMQIRWSDLAREHGDYSFGGQIKQANLVGPSLMTQFVTSPELGPFGLTDKVKMIEGRKAYGYGQQLSDEVSRSQEEQMPELDSWIVDDEQGFLHGTEKEIIAMIRGDVTPFDSVSPQFLTDYKESAFAVAFTGCDGWGTKLREFHQGSKHEAQWAVAAPMFTGLSQLGLFVQGRTEGDCRVRAVYADDAAAAQAKLTLEGIRVLLKGFIDQATEESPEADDSGEATILAESLQSLRIEQIGPELQITFDLPSSFIPPMNLSKVPSWVTLDNPVTLVEEIPGAVRLEAKAFGCIGGFLAQSVQAKSYLGKRVRLVAELAGHRDATDRAGLFLCSSGEQERSLTFQSQSIDGKSDIESLMTHMSLQDYLRDQEGTWTKASIEVNVPTNSQVLTLGCYSKEASLRIRNIRLEILGDEVPSTVVNKPWLPWNLFVIPGAVLHDAPRNMDFRETEPTSTKEPSQVAEGKAESNTLRR
ncbi:MAG: hypothetical protein ABL921_06115, partial [Pirellula sp.]